jgi:hypothetical protein
MINNHRTAKETNGSHSTPPKEPQEREQGTKEQSLLIHGRTHQANTIEMILIFHYG